jgi:hypothetical protein
MRRHDRLAGDTDAPGWLKVIDSLAELFGAPGPAPTPAPRAAPSPRQYSICVLPFANMSGDAEQEYFSDGISEDIITDLTPGAGDEVRPAPQPAASALRACAEASARRAD